ncbi:MAG: hypothetical protein ACP5NW_02150 [Candidatus Woesearchaeota archaeon]
MTKEPYGIISEVYTNPLTESSDILMNYMNSVLDLKRIRDTRDSINLIVQEKRSALGLDSIRELNLSSNQASILRDEIKNDNRWEQGMDYIVSLLAPDLAAVDMKTKKDAIVLPWWNAAILARQGGLYEPIQGNLSIDAIASHSYITQLTRSLKIPQQHKTESMSISNVLITKDDFVILGIRGGHSYANILMVLPAGSVEYHTGKNPLFETLYAEHFEETGLSKDQLDSTEFIGRIYDPLGRCSLYVSRTHTKLNFSDLVSLWGSAIDRREHKFLVSIKDHPQEAINMIQSHMYHPEFADPKSASLTTLENVNTLAPPAVSSLLTHYAQREGKQWSRKAESLLNGTYVFKD